METSKIIRWCASNCEHQRSGEMSVYHMYKAYEFAVMMSDLSSFGPVITYDILLELGRLVEPVKNENGFRRTPVTINSRAIPWVYIERSIDLLLKAYTDDLLKDSSIGDKTGAYSFLKEFEIIHPFIDGNGRVGAILYNYINGTLDNLTMAPEIF